MERFILEGPQQLVEAAHGCAGLKLPPRRFRRVLLLGMGGSALSGGLIDLLRHVQRSGWDWRVVREYEIPCPVGPDTLVFALSYSGNTEEVLETFSAATHARAPVVAVSAGGRLEAAAAAAGVPWIRVPPKPDGFQPRFALYFMFGVLYEVLCRQRLLKPIEPLDSLCAWLTGLDLAAQGRDVAEWLGPRIPVVYTPPAFESGVARTWRIKFNENAKIPALCGALPEANHNEMIAFTPEFSGLFAFLLLTCAQAHPRIPRRFELLSQMLEKDGYPVRSLPLAGENVLRQALSSLMLADWVSCHLAIRRGADPVAIPAIQSFKKDL